MTRPHNVCRRCAIRHSPKCPEPRWPLQPLLDAIGNQNPHELFNVNGTQLDVYRCNGIGEFTADRWAYKAGLHPAQVWGDAWIEAGLSVVDEQFLDSGWRRAWESNVNEKEQAA